MTIKPKASKFRIKRDGPLTPGQALAATDGATARKIAMPLPEEMREEMSGEMETAQEAETAPDNYFEPEDDGFGPEKMPTAAGAEDGGGEAPPRSGEVTSAASARSEQTIADIRKEGLTGRQLRMARRVAQKHGLAPTSDFDAVKQLRDRGIDPFRRANMLELVQDNARNQLPDTRQGATPNLPQVARQGGRALAVPDPQHPGGPAINTAEQRAGEIARIQRDIARRRRRKSALLFTRLAFFVLLPTFIAGWYYYVLATPMYATTSEFSISKAEAPSTTPGLGGLLSGTSYATQQDSTTVQSYLQSRDAMLRLDRDHGFKAAFQTPGLDPIQRLDSGATNEAAYKVFKKNVKIGYDPSEGILKMEVIAPDPQVSADFSNALLGYAEEQVDHLTQRVREDLLAESRQSFADAEQKVQNAQTRVLELQEQLGVLDPLSESTSLMQQITQFEVELRQKELDLQQQLSNPRPNQARVRALEGEISRLRALVANLRASMTETTDSGASLARITGELRIAEAELQTRQLLLQQAAAQLETARIDANRQVRYISVGVAPVAPDEATYPRAFENTALALLIFAGIYLMISLTASVLREQVAA